MSQPAEPTTTCAPGFRGLLECGSGGALDSAGATVQTVVATIGASLISLGIQLLAFVILRLRLTRIYRPRTYLVPERERTTPPPGGLIGWIYPLFTTSNLTIIKKCGLDAYFFLRYLRLLLKIFLPVALLLLPILLPINATGKGDAKGMDRLSISNIGPSTVGQRLWAQLILAIIVILWIFYVIFQELRGYIRIRQAYLTSPEHRIRASATTVLVTGIPRKWLTMEALSGLYDVFPGGIRNIWINRDYNDLSSKVSQRHSIAMNLESAETNLIKACRKEHMKAEKKRAKKERGPKRTKEQQEQAHAEEDAAAQQMAQSGGMSAGATYGRSGDAHDSSEEEHSSETDEHKSKRPLEVVEQGLGAVGQGLGAVGKGVGKLGGLMVGGVEKANDNLNRATDAANAGAIGGGFADDESLYKRNSAISDTPPTPPPKPGLVPFEPVTDTTSGLVSRTNTKTRPGNLSHGQQYLSPSPPVAIEQPAGSPHSESTLGLPDIQTTRPSNESRPKTGMEIEEPAEHKAPRKLLQFFKDNDRSIAFPSPQPHTAEEDEFPLKGNKEKITEDVKSGSKVTDKLAIWKSNDEAPKDEYAAAFDKEWDEDQDEDPVWRRYIEPKDRETMRLPLFSPTWFPSLPLVGKKVDKIYYLRRELARLNLEIEADQNSPDKYPLMNSAFIQFNHQVAAHMCCQSLSHHIPQQMAPRLLEISPDDIIWDNMAIRWWERYLRTGIVLVSCAALIVFYAIPVGFTSLLYNVGNLGTYVPWLDWLTRLPKWIIGLIQGLLPPLLLNLILSLVPTIFRLLVKQQGVPTGNLKELGVQAWYFTFLFIQVFLVVTLVGGLTYVFQSLASNPLGLATTLASNMPKAADYFFSYLTVQALSNAASALLQVGTLFSWFILAPLMDSTARAKWRRQTNLSTVDWGTFFPTFTNFAVIGIIYSVLAPMILVFMLVIFASFWIAYRYSVLYVTQFKNDTGGLLFPAALQQLFVGIYFLELCLIGQFFTQHNENKKLACIPQGVIMIIFAVLTIIFQWLLIADFKPLLQYLPITLEDEAVLRDEAFAKAQDSKFAPLQQDESGGDESEDIEDVLERREQDERGADDAAEEAERRDIEMRRRSRASGTLSDTLSPADVSTPPAEPRPRAWHQRTLSKPTWKTDKWKKAAPEAVARLRFLADGTPVKPSTDEKGADLEAQRTVGDVLFSGFADELEDLSAEDRDLLVRYSFQHSALRARRPVVWIPRDKLGVSDDEIRRAKRMSTVPVDEDGSGAGKQKTFIWMSNEGTALDSKGRVVFGRSPPDFSNVDLISL